MAQRFVDSMMELFNQTPTRIKGRVVVDQVYAHYQHEHPEFHHPDGGQAFYLSEPLLFKARGYIGHLAGFVLKPGGLRKGMTEVVEDLSKEVYQRAPWEFGDLRASGHPIVEEDGKVTYDRAPLCKRLTTEELRIKGHLRYLIDPHRYGRR